MQDEDDLSDLGAVQLLLHNTVANASITGGIIEVALYETFENVEDDPMRFVVDSNDGAAEGEG